MGSNPVVAASDALLIKLDIKLEAIRTKPPKNLRVKLTNSRPRCPSVGAALPTLTPS
jgi:hypothetical protein